MKIYFKLLFTLALAAISAATALSQELNCTVEINSSQVQGTNKSVFQTLQEAMTDYMNTTQFTPAQFATNEKIECKLFFTIKEYTDGVMKGDLQVQSTRPVYNSSYTTPLINFKDNKIEFAYNEGDPLVFSELNFESNLTAILNYYAYLILALDFDSFSPRGGQACFDRLATIVQQAQASGETGWKAFEDTKNRSAVLSAFTDPATQAIRDFYYKYHLKGLDHMAVSPDRGRLEITDALSALKTMYDKAPMSVGLSIFKDTKLDELVNIYSEAPADERTTVYEILSPIYPTENTRLNQIKKGKEQR